MANLKRAAALALSAAMFLQPMTASAVTWGSVLGFIRMNNGAEKKTQTFDDTTVEVQNGVATITGGRIEDGVEISDVGPKFMSPGSVSHFVFQSIHLMKKAADSHNANITLMMESGNSGKTYALTLGEGVTVDGDVWVNSGTGMGAVENTTFTVKIEEEATVNGNVGLNAIRGGTIIGENSGSINGEMMGCADGDNSTAKMTNKKGGEVGALDGFSRGEGATMTIINENEGTAGKLLANALVGGKTEAKNDGNVVGDMSGWSKGDGSTLTITNNSESGTMSAEAYLDGKASLTNNGLADGGMGGYTDGGRVDLVNNGEVNGNMAVGAEKEGHVSADNRESGTVYGDLKGWTDGVGSTAVISNSGDVAGGKPQLNGALMTLEARAPARISAAVALDADSASDSETYHDDETTPESVTSEEAKPGTAGEGVLSGERRGSGTVVVEDKNSGTTNVNGKKVDAMLNVTSSTTQAEIQSQLAALPIWEKPGEYTVLIKCVGENDEVTYEAVTILVEGDEEPAEGLDLSEEAFRHEMEMKRQAGAVGGVYGSPYWVKQLYLGYHSYNLRLFVGGTRENFREELSWSAGGSKSVSLRVNNENPEKLTMRFDEKVLEVLERTNITTVTLLNKSGAAVMQYNVSDLRAAYDGFGLDGADQLVVGGADDDVMKIGADGQLVPVES